MATLLAGVAGTLGLSGAIRADEPVPFSTGEALLHRYHCGRCHQPYASGAAGPSLHAIAGRYADDPHAREDVAARIVNGSVGAWGDAPMRGYDVPPAELQVLVDWILSLQR